MLGCTEIRPGFVDWDMVVCDVVNSEVVCSVVDSVVVDWVVAG